MLGLDCCHPSCTYPCLAGSLHFAWRNGAASMGIVRHKALRLAGAFIGQTWLCDKLLVAPKSSRCNKDIR
ncbi:hypothetical protein CGRA01v4_11643 [Colletotrichum graminicola]|nr:hypothetical protein CGRA01v4_11643 [Colletotrichum graminicola]